MKLVAKRKDFIFLHSRVVQLQAILDAPGKCVGKNKGKPRTQLKNCPGKTVSSCRLQVIFWRPDT